MSKRPPGSYFRNKKKQKEAEAKELATQWEKSKSKWFNVKNEQKINTLKDGASEIQKINESIQIEIDSGCSQIEQTSNINELSFQEIPLEMDENILVDNDLSHGITEKTEKQSLVDEEINVLQPPEIIFNNPQSWPTITDKLRCILVQNGPNRGKLDYKPFKNHWFYKKLPNGESVERSWMMYSQPNDAIFCFCCMLFGKQFTALSDPKRGFSCWKKMERLKEHEDSQDHVKHYLEWKMLENKLLKGGGIDDSLQKEIQSEQEKWRHVLKIILDVLLYCANNNLALRGNSEDIGNPAAGHFLNLISLISKSDGVLRQHIESHKKGSVSYFSHHIQDEFISLLSKKVREKIINQIKSAKYFTIMFDCTPDVSKREQMSEVIRYVHISNGKVCIEESFLGFILSHEKTGKGLASEILTQLSDDDLNIQNCRGQAYDNGANMAGKYKGVQAKIMEKNSLATFVPCTAHSLNLAGVNAASSNVQMKNFFGKIQQLFNFFAGSPSRWEELKSLKLTLKPFSDTRWSSKSVAIKAVFTQLPEVKNALNNIIEKGNAESIFLAKSLLLSIDYEFICLLSIWNSILSSIDRVNVCLQSKSLTINKAANLIKGLINEITDLRNNRLETLFKSAEELTTKMGIATDFPQKRIKRVKLLDLEESTDDWNATSKKNCIINLKNVCDVLTMNMNWRFEKLNQISSDFGFLNGADLVERDSNYLIKAAADLAIKYDNDLNLSDFTSEILNFKNLALSMLPDLKNQSPLNILELIHEYSMTDIFPNICIAIRLYLTLPCTTASCERSFSKLKLIKTYLRSTMNQNRLTNLSLLSIEKEITKTVDFDSVIDNFSAIKARKIKF